MSVSETDAERYNRRVRHSQLLRYLKRRRFKLWAAAHRGDELHSDDQQEQRDNTEIIAIWTRDKELDEQLGLSDDNSHGD